MPNAPPTDTSTPLPLAATATIRPSRRGPSMMTTPVIVFVVIGIAAALVLGGSIIIYIRYKANQARTRRRQRELEAPMEQRRSWYGSRERERVFRGYETTFK